MSSPIIIAIDGPSASGKGTVAKRLAKHFDFAHLDTGLLYRAVGHLVLEAKGDPSHVADAEVAVKKLISEDFDLHLKHHALRKNHVSKAASEVAAIPSVRDALLKFQKDFCANPPDGKKGAVLDGRDIGTVIAPHADVKLYVTASVEARAERRHKELQSRGDDKSYHHVLKELQERDARDENRATAPAKPAKDAVTIDTTHMDADAAFAEALRIVESNL